MGIPVLQGGEDVKLAMGWHGRNRHHRQAEITLRHVRDTARRCGLEARLPSLIDELRNRLTAAIEKVGNVPPEHVPTAIAGPILERTGAMVERLTGDAVPE